MCVWCGLSTPEGASGVRLLKEGTPHPEQTGPLTWAPASRGHSSGSAPYLADRPLQASSGGTAACSSRQRYQVGRAGDTESRSSLARRTHSCLCLQSMVHSACSGHSWEEKEFMENTGDAGVPTQGSRGTGEQVTRSCPHSQSEQVTISTFASLLPSIPYPFPFLSPTLAVPEAWQGWASVIYPLT